MPPPELLRQSMPSPPRRSWRAPLAIGGAIAVAVAVLVVAWSLDRGSEAPREPRGREIVDLVKPAPLTESEREGRGEEDADPWTTPGAIELAEGGWVQVADESGRLSQQYAASRMDPLPDRWVKMTSPRAVFFSRDGRVTTLEGDRGTARIPEKALESGSLEGRVRIAIHRPIDGRPVDLDRDAPWVTILADQADFDGAEGRIRCDEAVSIQSEEIDFAGEGMLLVLDASGRDLERLEVERATRPLILRRRAVEPRKIEDATAPPTPAPTAPADQPPAPATAAPPTSPGDPASSRFVRLVIEQDVVIVRRAAEDVSTIRADRLSAVFSLEGGGLDAIVEAAPAPRAPGSPASFLAASALAAPQEPSVEATSASEIAEEVEITFAGTLVLEPLAPRDPRPLDQRDVWVRLDGAPVEIEDSRREARIRGARVDSIAGPSGDRLDLVGGEGPIRVDSPTLVLEAPAASWRSAEERAILAGPGMMELRPAGEEEVPPVRIEWREEVDLLLAAGGERLRRADFEGGVPGGVQVRTDELRLSATRLVVDFVEGAAEDRLERLAAEGEVVARRIGEPGGLEAEKVLVELVEVGGGSKPRRVLAMGGARAFDRRQVVHAETIEALLLVEETTPSSERAIDAGGVERAVAQGRVVVGLEDGTWVFADRLDGDAVGGRLDLAGDDLAIVRDGAVLDRMTALVLRDVAAARSVETPDAGRLRAIDGTLIDPWKSPVGAEDLATRLAAPPVRPDPSEDLRLAVAWSESMRFEESPPAQRTGGDAGRLELRGAVKARSRGDAGADDRIAADRIEVFFAEARREGDAVAAPTGDLEPRRLEATGEAVLEARRRAEGAASDAAPDLFRLAGPRLEYDLASGEGRVPGAGTLLVAEPSSTAVGAGRGGTSRFSWDGRLDLTRESATRSRLTLADDVELIHASGGDADGVTLTADRMEVLVDRPEGATLAPETAVAEATLVEVRGIGKVFVRSRDRDVEGDAFEYDAEEGIATLTARAGRTVSVLARDAPGPTRAEKVTWNLRTGRIEIIGARGEGGAGP